MQISIFSFVGGMKKKKIGKIVMQLKNQPKELAKCSSDIHYIEKHTIQCKITENIKKARRKN